MVSGHTIDFTIERLPEHLRQQLCPILSPSVPQGKWLDINEVHGGDAQQLLPRIEPNSIALSVWSPPYFVGKQYESYLTFDEWKSLLRTVIKLHFPIIKPGGFVVINIADILCFKDSAIPRIQAEAIDRRKCSVTREDVLKTMSEHPDYNRYKIADLLHCSEQTVDRRLHGNNIRGGKHALQTRVKIVGGLIEEWTMDAGFYLYDRRIWIKDPAWENDPWNTLSYRSIDEFEYLYFLWKPGIVKVRRSRLSAEEWREWGTRAIWRFPSVRKNNDHEAKFPEELPRRAIRLLTDPGDIVLDCFLGSGTTALAAIKEKRQFIGIELQEKYVTLARSQIAALGECKDVS
jgi:site-specific DNA-methyltransferase (adenine-specific)